MVATLLDRNKELSFQKPVDMDKVTFGTALHLLNTRAASEPENAPQFLVLEESIRTRLIA